MGAVLYISWKWKQSTQVPSQGPGVAPWHTLCCPFFCKLCNSVIDCYRREFAWQIQSSPISKRSRGTWSWVVRSYWVWFHVAFVGSEAEPSLCIPVSLGTLDSVENSCCCQVKKSNCWLRDTLPFTGFQQNLAPSKCSMANAREVHMSLLPNSVTMSHRDSHSRMQLLSNIPLSFIWNDL